MLLRHLPVSQRYERLEAQIKAGNVATGQKKNIYITEKKKTEGTAASGDCWQSYLLDDEQTVHA